MPLHQFAAEIEAESCSTESIGTGIVCSLEAAEDACLLLHWNTYPRITNTQQRRLRFGLFTDADLDRPSCWAILDRISNEVGEHLLNAPRIHVRDQVL